ncbi:MAG: replication initiator protein A [Oscillospiraceae bacterium]|nr:replication initiator protein A [Oscillospiraceae bacterium]
MNQFSYFYTNQAEKFTFYRIPKALFTDERFIKLSTEAKMLYGLMLDRMELSRTNGLIDKMNRVYIYFTPDEVMERKPS